VKGHPLIFTPGARYGELTVIETMPGGRGTLRRIKCRCDCGTEYLAVPHHLNIGETVRCFSCLPKRKSPELKALIKRFSGYRASAAKRGHAFKIEVSDFIETCSEPCTYCGLSPSLGIDRRDNARGYIRDNCSPCCKSCNYAKRTMTERDFLDWIARIAQHQGLSL
jgi:hypothetical protein